MQPTIRGFRRVKVAQIVATFFLFSTIIIWPIAFAIAKTDTSTSPGLSESDSSPSSSAATPVNPSATLNDLLVVPTTQASADKTPVITPISSSTVTLPVEQERGPPPKGPKEKTKFIKNPALSEADELAAVKQHLIDNNVPQEIIDRVDAFQSQKTQVQQPTGFFQKIADFFSGNTDEQKQQEYVQKMANLQPFAVEGLKGPITKENESNYKTLFSNSKEQGNLMQKVQNLLKSGTLYNSNFDNTDKKAGPLSLLTGQAAQAMGSDNPSDYLAAGNEIIFSQAIKDKATALNKDPLTILNFVRNNVRYVPYYGSKKGSDATLVESAGNDMDKAALFIAMMRYSNIPARYRQADVKMGVNTVTDLLGVRSATAAANVLTLNNIPYILFVDNDGNPLFFVVEHTYVDIYIPYGYSRGVDLTDGGKSAWIPVDPSVNAYYYEQPVDIIAGMNGTGFNVETFFEQYLGNAYKPLGPYDAFKSVVSNYLAGTSPSSTFDNAVVHSYPKQDNLEFVPGTLPYQVVVDLDSYAYVPTSLRHTIVFIMKNDVGSTIMTYNAYVSDLADHELLVTYDAATPADQTTLNTFNTIYDVVPLSLVAVSPKIKINGVIVGSAVATTTLGKTQTYTMDFNIPTRAIGGSVTPSLIETVNRNVITGNTDAIALDTDQVLPPELRPTVDTQTSSFVSNQLLYRSALDYLYRLDSTQGILAKAIGGDYVHAATRATVFNGISITYSGSQPFSFAWKGLRIDSSVKVRYFNRFNDDISIYRKEFSAIFGLQASQDESGVFEDDLGVESIGTVKGLKLVASSTFPGVTLHKITAANSADIDTLSISTGTMAIFHAAVNSGKTVFTPSAPVTYGSWTGLFYITIDFDKGIAGYIIGEGLNGGFTICGIPGVLGFNCSIGIDIYNSYISPALASNSSISADINLNGVTTGLVGQAFHVTISYVIHTLQGLIFSWVENKIFQFNESGTKTVVPSHNVTTTVKAIVVTPSQKIGTIYNRYDDNIIYWENTFGIPRGVLKSIINQETLTSPFEFNQYRYEPKVDSTNFSGISPLIDINNTHPYKHFRISGHTAGNVTVFEGDQVSGLSPSYTQIVKAKDAGWAYRGLKGYTGNETFAQLVALDTGPGSQNWPTLASPDFTAQTLLSASYGLGHVLYLSAMTIAKNMDGTLWFDTSVSGNARSIYDISDADTGIHLAAAVLRYKYNHNTQNGTDCGGWGQAVQDYNGGVAYRHLVCDNYYEKNYKP